MSIIRTSHNKENPYVQIHKKTLEDPKLSWAAKGLWAYLMSRPDNWRVNVSHLSKIYDCDGKKGGGEKAIWTLLNELIDHGYCERITNKSSKGLFIGVEYVITEFKNKVPHRLEGGSVDRGSDKVGINKEGPLGPSISPVKSIRKKTTTTSENEPVVVVSSDLKKVYDYLENLAKKWGEHWIISKPILSQLIKKYGIVYLSAQLNYMGSQHHKHLRDIENPYQVRKTPPIANPEMYIKIACKENYAESSIVKVSYKIEKEPSKTLGSWVTMR